MEIIPIRVPFPKGYGMGDDTNAYLLKGEHPVLIDTGVDSAENREYLRKRLQAAESWGLKEILITHGHHDHFGLAAFLQAETGAEVLISEVDSGALQDYGAYSLKWFDEVFQFGLEGGYDRQELEEQRMMFSIESDFIARPRRYTPFRDLHIEVGDTVLDAVCLPGHTRGIVGYAVDDVVFCGDVVINDRANITNLEDELNSLAKLKNYRKIYPGHSRFPLTRNDIQMIEVYLIDRCRCTLRLVEGGKKLREIVEGLYGKSDERGFMKKLIPVKQTIAYLRFLELGGDVVRKEGKWWPAKG